MSCLPLLMRLAASLAVRERVRRVRQEREPEQQQVQVRPRLLRHRL